ncbi:hypothetical protein [Nocardia sp. NBC_01329]|uniref:hypothetical protein n=1 Tax=Nocardia sp. NBC_01329 TaxID=2903594 RepID=UPI002E0D832A|nr:hypothetical protein OG405_02775 [Nocardia sp. NBC_01329]
MNTPDMMAQAPTPFDIKVRQIIAWAVNRLEPDNKARRIQEGDRPRIHPGEYLTRFTWGRDFRGEPLDLILVPTLALRDDSVTAEEMSEHAESIPTAPDDSG